MKVPTTDLARRIAGICHRRPTTPWNERELRVYKQLYKAGLFVELDVANLERYYTKHWPPDRDKNILRHDLLTLMNNLQGEIDRANIWCERHPVRPQTRKIIPLPPLQSDEPVIVADPATHQRFLDEYAQHKAAKGKA